MKPIFFAVATFVFAGTLSGSAEARGSKGSTSSAQPGSTGQAARQLYTPKIVIQNFVQPTQKSVSQSQKNQNSCWWTRCCWFPQFRCCGYFCPDDGCWYYYCGSRRCYLPVSYMNMCPPDSTNQGAG